MGAVGEEAVEQQAFLGQLVEIRGDALDRAAQRADRVTGEALHEDHHHIANRQGVLGWRSEFAADRRAVGVDQPVVGGQQHLAGQLGGLRRGQGRLPGVVAVRAEAVGRGVRQAQRAVQAKVVGEDRLGGVGVAPAQRRALAQVAAGGDHRHQQAEEEHQAAHMPARPARRRCRAGGQVDALEQQVQQPGGDRPGQQVAADREAVPQHARHGAQVFLEVLEHQAVQALVELTVEVQLGQAEEQGDAGPAGQPQAMEATRRHQPRAEQRQQQRDAGVDHQAQVETQAVEERLAEHRRRGIADQVAVVGQQRHPQRGIEHQQQRTAEQGEGQVAVEGRVGEACRGRRAAQGIRGGHCRSESVGLALRPSLTSTGGQGIPGDYSTAARSTRGKPAIFRAPL
ncbi:hypothetical protein D9M70_364360 [compost metagenome]